MIIPFGFWGNLKPVLTDLLYYYNPNNIDSYSGSGTTLNDLSTNNYTATLVGGVSFSDGVFQFDGTNDKITLNSNITTTMYSASFTISSFVKPETSPPSQQCFASFANDGDATQRRLRMRINSDGSLQMSYFANDLSTSSSLITFGNWYMLTMQYDSGSDISRIWINDTEITSSNVGPFLSGTGTRGFLGGYDSTLEAFKGDYGVALGYSKNLSESEIKQNFNAFKNLYNI
jgi:hypothetical protein